VAKCNRQDCGRGDIDYQGFCSACARRPLPESGPPTGAAEPAAPPPAQRAGRVRPEPWWGLDLVTADAAPETTSEAGTEAMSGSAGDPADPDMTVPENARFCGSCGKPVGRGRDGRSGRVKGFCPACREPFDFTRSRTGEIIAGRYEIMRKVGRGGHGTALLAHDRNLDIDVVLKDLSSPEVAETARTERDTLTGLRHDNIVRIYGYEPLGPYLILEYVLGAELSARPGDPLEVILAHGLQILQALDYLHARGLLHMDVKPANVIRFSEQGADGPRDRIRLIDFGAVWKLGKPGPVEVCTWAYAPQKDDRERLHPTRGFDLYCLGTTLQELCRSYLRDPATPAVTALDLTLKRATHEMPERRFVSARQFAEQLSGVIRQAVVTHPDKRVIRPSVIFGSMTQPLHGGLGAPRPVGHWIDARVSAGQTLTMAAPFGAPTPGQVVAALPAPLADPDDPGLTRSCGDSIFTCLTTLRNGDPDAADRALREANLPDWAWIRDWYRGLIALARGDRDAAGDRFSRVRDALPGDLIPLLALGLCAEINGRLRQARQHYAVVSDTAPSLSAAGLGLARAHLLAGNRAAAVAAAKRLAADLQSQELRAEHEARIAVVRLLAAVTESSVPTEGELAEAEKLADGLPIDADQQILLRAEIQYGRSFITGDWLALSEMIHKVAKQARTRQEFISMIDLANRLRPPIDWWWQRGFQAIRLRKGVDRGQ
jgi:serine/threonine-protein kinase PknG